MNVLIIELGGSHTENIHSLIFLLKKKNSRINIVCNRSLWELFPDQSVFEDHLLVPDILTFTRQVVFFLKIRRFIKKNKIKSVIIGTTELTIIRNLVFFLPSACTYTGVLHNAEKLEKGVTLKNIVFYKIRKFLVLSNYLYKNARPLPRYKLDVLLPVYFPVADKKKFVTKNENDLCVIIPGIVETLRRDYIPFLKELKKHPSQSNIKIIFLGKFNPLTDKELAEQLNSLGSWKGSIITFDYFLSYEEFHSYIASADIILPLLKMENEAFYGDSRVSGSVNLGLGYHKPFIVPGTYKENEDIQSYSLYYDSYSELFEILFLKKAELNEALNKIRERYVSAYFNDTDQVAERLYNFIVQ